MSLLPNRRGPLSIILQLAGFAAGLAMLAWCVREALRPENRDKLERLGDASPTQLAGLIALSLASLAVNALSFRSLLSPVHRLKVPDILAINSLCTWLNYLPFKLGAITRVLIHNRRDAVPVFTIGAWFVALALVMLSVCGPLIAVSLLRPTVDTIWITLSPLGVLVAAAALHLLARFASGDAGRSRATRLFSMLTLGLSARPFAQTPVRHAIAGADMLASPHAFSATLAWRVIDLSLQAARFMLAASVIGHSLSADRALLAALAFFLIGVFSPAGMLGTREGGTAWLLPLVASSGEDTSWFAAAVLIVGASELITNTACAALGLIYLRPDRLLRSQRSPHASPLPENQPSSTPLPSPDEARPGPDQSDHR
ncbi:MAG: hypothetical protein IT434_16515 [Phycisphaerales bacterium]|nr:hypothetical protein [Phycisphaerales bacterium]